MSGYGEQLVLQLSVLTAHLARIDFALFSGLLKRFGHAIRFLPRGNRAREGALEQTLDGQIVAIGEQQRQSAAQHGHEHALIDDQLPEHMCLGQATDKAQPA